MDTYLVPCAARRHVHSFTERELVEKFGRARAHDFVEDPEHYPLALLQCEDCLEADEKPRPGGLNYLRARYGVPI